MGAGLGDVTGALLIGGASSRMGRDKARLPLGGEPLATTLAHRLAHVCAEVLLVGGEPPAEAPGCPVPDPAGPRCALRGIVAALAAAETPRVLVLATDMPAVDVPLLLALAALPEADAVLPRTDRPEPLCAIYRREPVLARARTRLAQGELTLRGLLEEGDVTWLEGDDLAAVGGAAALANVNTPDEWAGWQAAQDASRVAS